ncbi:MAG: helix-turn-helix transcriptional regulator [Dehalococcoidia bacterium]|nr:helix-turn-helix transcriptional regulator [Dehalococcoidia bacterium]
MVNQTISKIEQEIPQSSIFELVALAKALKVSTAWLLEEANKQNIPQ